RRADVDGVADEHDPAPVPRPVQQVGFEPGVVYHRWVGDAGADVVPGAVVVRGEFAQGREVVERGELVAVAGRFDHVGVHRVRPGRAVPRDEADTAVVEVGAGD